MPRKIDTVGIDMPDDFPADAYNEVHAVVSPKREPYPAPWPEWAGGWNAVAYRFMACAEHDTAFSESTRCNGNSPAPFERYIQDNEVFGFFVTGLATIESLCYGVHAIAAMMDPKQFPMDDESAKRSVTPVSTASRFSGAFPDDRITAALKSLLADTRFDAWVACRNVLAHRVAPARNHFRGGEFSGKAFWPEVEVKAKKRARNRGFYVLK